MTMLPCCAQSFNNRIHKGIETGFLEKEANVNKIANQLQTAEFFQLFFLGTQALLYGLALQGHFSIIVPGITTLALIPLEAIAYYRSMVLYGKHSRCGLTAICCTLFVLAAIFSILQMPGDYALSIFGGGFIVQIIRLLSEKSDSSKKKVPSTPYQRKEEKVPFLMSSLLDRARRAKHAGFIDCPDSKIQILAKKIQAAEIFQLFYFSGLALIFGLQISGQITSLQAGICTLVPLPIQACASYKSMLLFGSKSRTCLTLAMVISMAATGIFSILGLPGDYTWLLCLGNLLFNTIRVLSERSDYQKVLKASHQKNKISELSK